MGLNIIVSLEVFLKKKGSYISLLALILLNKIELPSIRINIYWKSLMQ